MVDYFGHFWVEFSPRVAKHWGCVFTCIVMWVVHIEVSDSLTQESFIHVYRHFLAIWGQNTTNLFSDNRTNLRGACKTLCQTVAQFVLGRFCRELCNRGMSWHFSPARSGDVNGVVQ